MKGKIPPTMLAAVWRGGPGVQVEPVPVPVIGPGELLVRVEACGICPTDVKKIDLGLVDPPVILGHEIAGKVVAAGNGAAEFLGKRVAVYHHVPCRECMLCNLGRYSQCAQYKKTGTTAGFSPAGGGWAEYVKVSPWIVDGGGVVQIPKSFSATVAILMEPLNTCLKCVGALPEPKGSLVILGQGPVGLMLTALAHRDGWRIVAVEPLLERREKAVRFGAHAALPPGDGLASRLREIAGPLGPDAAIAATDSEAAIGSVLQSLRPGATLILFAHTRKGQKLSIDAGQVGVAEKQIIGSYSSSIDLNEATSETLLDARLPWSECVTHVFPLDQVNRALDLSRHPSEGSLKIAVAPRAKALNKSLQQP